MTTSASPSSTERPPIIVQEAPGLRWSTWWGIFGLEMSTPAVIATAVAVSVVAVALVAAGKLDIPGA